MKSFTSFTLLVASLGSLRVVAQAPSNPLKVASAVLLGNRLSTNDQTIRDLGYQGHIGMNSCFRLYHT